jgi:hypothetical protein
MDGESFDRLSVVVHRLHDNATRRGALALVLGGSAAALSGLLADDAGAKKHNKNGKNKKNKDCHGFGAKCGSNKDCCYSNCRSGHCWYGNGSQSRCGGKTCDNGWGCCNFDGVSVCVPNTYPVCCGNQSFVNGYTCCGGNGGACLGGIDSCTGQFGICCQSGWKHCSSGFWAGVCVPNYWDCNSNSQWSQAADIAAESTESVPTTEPQPISPADYIDL